MPNDPGVRATDFTSNTSLSMQDRLSEREPRTKLNMLRNCSRDSTSNVMNQLSFMSSSFLVKDRDKLSS